MGDLTKNISRRHELACSCGCGFNSMDWETIEVVQGCCDYFADKLGLAKVILTINSAARCFEYNRSIGSNDNSQHPLARAIDFTIKHVSPADIYDYLNAKYPDKYGLGKYPTFTHFDARSGPKARW